MSIAEQEVLVDDICNDVLGYGPLEPLLMRDDIADIMVNGAARTYIERSEDLAHEHPVPRQCAADEYLLSASSARSVGASTILLDMRRASRRWFPRQRHRAAAGARRALSSTIRNFEGQVEARRSRQVEFNFSGRRRSLEDHRSRAL